MQVCSPGCNCSKPSSGSKTKIIAGSIIALIAAGIFTYKILKAQPPQETAAAYTNTQSPAVNQQKIPATLSNQNPKIKKQKNAVGEYLDSFIALNTIAINRDAVFILIPGKENEPVNKETETAMIGAQNTLKNKNVNIGLYTLLTNAPEYQNIIRQVSPPAIIVMCKGRGMNIVPGNNVTETTLLQAYVAGSSAKSCGPSCGPSQSGCQ